ncbi:hypothetical protein A4S06_03365 [Erysipelotrichaceae bacterium MTC7]|nr:hypothetical protein A4S06_03365 [Erysipelotrichaceae bacterium MTC7]
MLNHFVLVGRMVEKPELRLTSSNIKFATASVKVKRNFKNADNVYDHDIFQVTLWRGIAEDVIDVCESGSLVGVKGRIQTSFYTSEENKTYTNYEFIAEKVQFLDLDET